MVQRAVLAALARKGRQAWVILPASISGADKRNASWLAAHGVHVRLMPDRPTYLHAKLICTANEAFIGSENFSYSSLSENREVGVVLHQAGEIHRLQAQFRYDWARSRPPAVGTPNAQRPPGFPPEASATTAALGGGVWCAAQNGICSQERHLQSSLPLSAVVP